MAFAVACAGCDMVWRLDDLRPVPGPDAPIAVTCEQDNHDEDGDLHADACDRCPGIADDQADADGDGVGDVCDPSPSAANTIAWFESFVDEPELWRTVNGTWMNDGENLVYSSISLGVFGVTLYHGALPQPPFVVEYYFSVDSIDTLASGVSLLVDSDSTGKGISCGFQRHEQPLQDVVRNTYAQAVLSSETEIMTVIPGGYRVTASYEPDDRVLCTLTSNSGLTGGATTMSLPMRPAAGTLGMRSFKVGTRIHYIAIYK
jgi:hypothetical protein